MRAFFDSVAGRLGKDYVPGKSWKSLAEALLRLMPPMIIADLGAGDGSFLASPRAKCQESHRRRLLRQDDRSWPASRPSVIASKISNTASATWKSFPSTMLPSISSSSRSRCTTRCILSAPLPRLHAFSRPGGRIVILDLAKHRFEEAREMYADEWLGFSEAELEAMLKSAGFDEVQTSE